MHSVILTTSEPAPPGAPRSGPPSGTGRLAEARKAEVVKLVRSPAVWARIALLAVFLLAAVVIPGRATSQQAPHCVGLHCTAAGSVLWTTPLPGSWTAEPGVLGTVTEPDPAYAADGGGVAVVGSGTSVTGFDATTGKAKWHVSLGGLLPGSVIVSVRAFSSVIAIGVQPPAGQGGPARDEVILAAATGHQIRTYPAASYGGAVRADAATTVIVGSAAVTAYANATGRVRWQRGLGGTGATWRASGQNLYVSNPAGAGEVAAVRQINLATGNERVVRAQAGNFAGTLADVVDAPVLDGPAATVLLFTGASGVTAYGLDGRVRWQKSAAVLELADAAQGVVYLAEGAKLTGVEAASPGTTVSTVAISVAASLYWISGGVALGLDQNALGEAWGYSLAARRVAWTSVGLPWPHYFADISGLGGSTSGASDVALLAACGLTGTPPAASAAPPCVRPELAAVLIRSR